ncbi:MAG: c-type cytochrome [Gemmatimonadetes bacterium]|nr:c-type cytochrome [Gemmatimonadota bacterium]
MSATGRRVGGSAGRVSLMALGILAFPASGFAQDAQRGKAIYEKWCLECHGETGEGDGAGAKFMLPPPRNFTQAVYQIRTTASGELPTDADLEQVVAEGMPGTAMPEWKSKLSDGERKDVIAYIKKFSTFFEGPAPKPLDFGKAPSSSAEGIAEGRKTYEKLECFKCHGMKGRGEGKSSPTLKDDLGFAIRAADLTENWTFNGGGTVEDIYRRMRTGLDGTPMPSFSDVLDAKIITEEQLWRVAQYVRSLSPEKTPEVKEVIRAHPMTGKLPSGPTDSAWAAVEPQWIPLVGQIIQKPRWFMPNVDGVWVQAAHDDQTLAVKLSWDDRSQSPNPVWDEWLARVMKGASDIDGPLPTKQGPDRFWLQFPKQIPGLDDMERPYFLGGSTRKPVYLWRWASSPDASEEGTGTGFGQFTARPGSADVTHAAVYDQGQWQLQFTRPLVPTDTTAAPAFTVGRPIPIAFFASDGSNGETELRGSVSAWYAIYLDVPTPPTVYVAPVVAVLLTAGLCFMVVWRAQQRGHSTRG